MRNSKQKEERKINGAFKMQREKWGRKNTPELY
jgi:hypothetical protein